MASTIGSVARGESPGVTTKSTRGTESGQARPASCSGCAAPTVPVHRTPSPTTAMWGGRTQLTRWCPEGRRSLPGRPGPGRLPWRRTGHVCSPHDDLGRMTMIRAGRHTDGDGERSGCLTDGVREVRPHPHRDGQPARAFIGQDDDEPSPSRRAGRSVSRDASRITSAKISRQRSPASCPCSSFNCLKWSMSATTTV